MAMVAADFTGGEAEELRRAMGFKRSGRDGSDRGEAPRRAWRGTESPADAGRRSSSRSRRSRSTVFPKSHAASFALIAYASAYLKAHHPAAFSAALLNKRPMGFYHPATLVKDAPEPGRAVRPMDVARSGLEVRGGEDGAGCGSGSG